jgi:hypothetical protein
MHLIVSEEEDEEETKIFFAHSHRSERLHSTSIVQDRKKNYNIELNSKRLKLFRVPSICAERRRGYYCGYIFLLI